MTAPPVVDGVSWERTAAALTERELIARWRGPRSVDFHCPMPTHARGDADASARADWQTGAGGEPGRVVIYCHVCGRDETEAIVAALGLTMADLYDGRSLAYRQGARTPGPGPSPASRRQPGPAPRPVPAAAVPHKHAGPVESQHVYTDPEGTIKGRLDRHRCADPECPDIAVKGKPGHAFLTRTPDGRPGGARAFGDYLYRLPEVLAAIKAGRPVWLCEGEGDADAVAALGECGTSAYGGAKRKIRPAYLDALAGARVIVAADRDRGGFQRAAEWAGMLGGRAQSVRVVMAAIDRPGADVSDHLEAGFGLADMLPCHPAEELARLGGRSAPPGTARAALTLDLPDDTPGPPRGADAGTWLTAETVGGTWGSDDWTTWELARPRDGAPYWRKILDAAVIFGTERGLAADPDFAERAERDDPSEATEGAADVTVRYRRGGQGLEHTVRAMPASRARDMRALDKAGPSAWLGAKPTPANRAKLFEANLALSEVRGRPRDVVYGVTGHHYIACPDGVMRHVLIAGTNALGPDGIVDGLAVATDDRLAPWTWPAPLPASELTDALAVVFALLDAADPRVVVPQLAAVIRAWFGVWRDPADVSAADEVSPLCWSTGVTGHGKSGVLAASCNLVAPGLRYNVLPFKAGPADTGGISGPTLERLLFRCRDLLLPFDDLDPSISPAERVRWQSDLLRRAADQKSRGLSQRTGISLRDSMPPRALVAAGGEPLDGEDSALNRALNLPFDVGTVNLSALRDQTVPELRMMRARAGATVAARLMRDWTDGRKMLAGAREARRAELMPRGDARGPALRSVATVAELAAAVDAFLALAVRAGADRDKCREWRQLCTVALRDALARHLELIGSTTRSARFVDVLREAITAGSASLDDATRPGSPPDDALAAGWELSRGASLYAEDVGPQSTDRYRRRGPLVGWQAPDGSVWLSPTPSVAAARKLAEAAGDKWTGSTRTIGETLKADGALIITPNRAAEGHADADLPRVLRSAGMGKRAWHVKASAWGQPEADAGPAEPGPEAPEDDAPTGNAIYGSLDFGQPTGATGATAGQAASGTGASTGASRGPSGATTGAMAPEPTGAAESGSGESAGQTRGIDTPGRVGAKRSEGRAPAERMASDSRYPAGPVLLIDADAAYLADGDVVPVITPLADMLDQASGLGLGMARLHKSGRDADGHLYLTPAACELYGIPAEPPDVRTLALADDHPAAVALRAAGWDVSAIRPSWQVWRGSGPGRVSLSVTLLGWLDGLGLDELTAGDPSPVSLAWRLGRIAATAYPVRWSAGVTSAALMVALRPPTRLRTDPQTGDRRQERVPGSLAGPVPPSLYDAHQNHPAARARAAADECREESLSWIRPRQHWTETELAMPYAVAIDINSQFLAAAASLPVGLSAPRPMTEAELAALNDELAAAKPKIGPGVYMAEVSGLADDPRLPSPLTMTGLPPDGPLPLHAPTLRYARELGAAVTVSAGFVSDETGPYLDPWNRRLVAALLDALAVAGITPDMGPAAYLDAMAGLRERHPDVAAVLAVIKALAKAGIGRLRQDPTDAGVTDRATWRPDMRAEDIARARTDLHRKIMRTYMLTGGTIAPLAVSHDAVLYAADDPSALDVVPTRDGQPIPGAFRVGCRPGWVKHSHTLTMAEAVALAEAGRNPAAKPGEGED